MILYSIFVVLLVFQNLNTAMISFNFEARQATGRAFFGKDFKTDPFMLFFDSKESVTTYIMDMDRRLASNSSLYY
jgi:hypothetical protein